MPTDPEEQRRKARERKKQRYQERALAGLCRPCGKPLTALGSTTFLCGACIRRLRREYRRRADRQRKAEGRLFRGPKRVINTVVRATVAVDRLLLPALDVLKTDFRAKNPGTPLQTNTLIRETIRARFNDPAVRVGPRACDGVRIPGVQFNLSLDRETLAIVTRHAARTFEGNRAKTIRSFAANDCAP